MLSISVFSSSKLVLRDSPDNPSITTLSSSVFSSYPTSNSPSTSDSLCTSAVLEFSETFEFDVSTITFSLAILSNRDALYVGNSSFGINSDNFGRLLAGFISLGLSLNGFGP
ncbi:hypothetical protein WICPIJ_004340 [Wickerhamomyces pijperi]|uniref:Uncharacterized protein n=1 Tax=Wickerhamomyces pijperi TaxID=599730 RepID=A0A9P8Q7W4_WICPI|nr:hypothetical protein WICPIJ_004340 [Wickerhamomyces pijperi]